MNKRIEWHKRKTIYLCSLLSVLLTVCLLLTIANILSNSYISTFEEKDKGSIEIKLNDVVRNHVINYKFSGSVLVAKGESIILNEGYGYARRYFGRTKNTSKTKFLLGSITKTFTAEAVMQLADKNLLNLDDKVTKYFPEYRQWENVTIHQLLNHSSGIPNYYRTPMDYLKYYISYKTPEEIISRYKSAQLLFEPGTDYTYSNTNYIILSSIIEKVSGESYPDYLNNNVFVPMELSNTGYKEKTNVVKNMAKGYGLNMIVEINGFNLSNLYGAGGLYSCTEDLFKFFSALDEQKLLNDDSMVKTSYGYYGYGLSLENNDKYGRLVYHTGGGPGISTGMYKLVDEDLKIIILSNNQQYATKHLMEDLYDTVNHASTQ